MGLLKDFIHITIVNEMTINKKQGAGIIVVKHVDNEWKVLGMRLYGKYDIPKGAIEPDESLMDTALRETYEEAGLSKQDLNFEWGKEPYTVDRLSVFLASTMAEPSISKNPKTGIYEHHAALWLHWDEMHSKTYGYLKPIVKWAENIVLK